MEWCINDLYWYTVPDLKAEIQVITTALEDVTANAIQSFITFQIERYAIDGLVVFAFRLFSFNTFLVQELNRTD